MGIQINFRDTKNITLDDLLDLFPNSKFAEEIKKLKRDLEKLVINNHKQITKLKTI